MSEPVGRYAFLSYLRRGVAAEIPRVDGTGAEPRVALPVELGLNAGSLTATVDLALVGPGEVAGLDPRVVVRQWPARDVSDAEANFFPMVELSQPDLPWRYTPARATDGGRLRPWLCLVTLRDDEIESLDNAVAGPSGRLARVQVKTAEALPRLEQSWAWSHVQVSGTASVTPQQVEEILGREPHRVVARLISPRRLDPACSYTALLVPGFEGGRLAGLGRDVPADMDALAPAWTAGAVAVDLPVYFSWHFRTGTGGDFEFLVRQLQARVLPKEVGIRAMDATLSGAPPGPASSTPLDLEGALLAPLAEPRTWSDAERTPFVERLASLLNRPADLLSDPAAERAVAPPLYARWHAGQDRLRVGETPLWFQELNADPRLRVPAGLGTQVVQEQQQPLMAGAWRQIERVREANETLRFAQLARELAARLRERHLIGDDPSVLAVTAPLHARIKGSPETLRALLARGPAGASPLAAAFRRVTRPRGPLARRLPSRPAGAAPLLTRLNAGHLMAGPAPKAPERLPTLEGEGAGIAPDPAALAGLTRARERFAVVAVLSFGLALAALAMGGALVAAALAVAGAFALAARAQAGRRLEMGRKLVALREGRFGGADLRAAPPRADFVPVESFAPAPTARPSPAARGSDNAAAGRFRAAAAELLDEIQAEVAPGRVLRPAPLGELRQKALIALDPRATVVAAVRHRLRLAPGLAWQPADPLEPVMAYPAFDQPMYEPLRDLSADWLLPGLDRVPPSTVSLLGTNRRFIEAYMAGLNHEMARELLWNEYPTDQRGSYFRQFWDVRGFVPRPGTAPSREALRDIRPLHQWDPAGPLGGNRVAGAPMPENPLVLLIRSELLRRYPTAVIYAVKTVLKDGVRALSERPEDEHYPLFVGRLPPDVVFLGFDLEAAAVVGSPDPHADQGFYFVIQEQPTEPRFGLDVAGFPAPPLTSWNDLGWGHLAPGEDALAQIRYIDLDATLPDTSHVATAPGEPPVSWHGDAGTGPAGTRAAALAYITLQRPVRVAVHGSDMLP